MRILLVEDEHKIAASIKRGLEQESFAVDAVYDGEKGYDFASTEDYDVIILDLMLPKMDGLSVCKKLREDEIHTPILMLTALSQTEDKVKGLNTGADDYLAKPFSFNELMARIKVLTRRPKELLKTTLKTQNLTLDTLSKEVKINGKSINLSKTEYSILEYLLRNQKSTVSKEQIIAHVWNYDADILPNTVEVYIGYLRNKIEKPFKLNIIKTIRGFGYTIK